MYSSQHLTLVPKNRSHPTGGYQLQETDIVLSLMLEVGTIIIPAVMVYTHSKIMFCFSRDYCLKKTISEEYRTTQPWIDSPEESKHKSDWFDVKDASTTTFIITIIVITSFHGALNDRSITMISDALIIHFSLVYSSLL